MTRGRCPLPKHPLRWTACLIVIAAALGLASSFEAEGRPRYLRNLVTA